MWHRRLAGVIVEFQYALKRWHNGRCPDILSGMSTKIPVPKVVLRLIDQFQTHREAYHNGRYAERVIDRQIAATDGQIDRLVYELYGLTEDEIKIVEEATK
jgi:hypothetical protein